MNYLLDDSGEMYFLDEEDGGACANEFEDAGEWEAGEEMPYQIVFICIGCTRPWSFGFETEGERDGFELSDEDVSPCCQAAYMFGEYR